MHGIFLIEGQEGVRRQGLRDAAGARRKIERFSGRTPRRLAAPPTSTPPSRARSIDCARAQVPTTESDDPFDMLATARDPYGAERKARRNERFAPATPSKHKSNFREGVSPGARAPARNQRAMSLAPREASREASLVPRRERRIPRRRDARAARRPCSSTAASPSSARWASTPRRRRPRSRRRTTTSTPRSRRSSRRRRTSKTATKLTGTARSPRPWRRRGPPWPARCGGASGAPRRAPCRCGGRA